jgi:hypothetical protein
LIIWNTTYKNNKKKREKKERLPSKPKTYQLSLLKDTTRQWLPTNKTTPWWQSIHPKQQRRQSIRQQHGGQVSAK